MAERLYPLALVHLEINGHHIDVEAALSDTLPMPVLLGTDAPQLQDFIGQAFSGEHLPLGTEDVFAVTTRAQFLRQTDQGSNFTSQLLTELYRMLHIHRIKTTPYHPQTDGLVERFNQTLKSMLWKAATQEGRDWDKMIPFLLFAYREVPQSSTGFSPFELLCGKSVRGPLDLLRESWEVNTKTKESVVSYVLSICDKLDTVYSLVADNLREAQRVQKCGTIAMHAIDNLILGTKYWYYCQQIVISSWLNGRVIILSFSKRARCIIVWIYMTVENVNASFTSTC